VKSQQHRTNPDVHGRIALIALGALLLGPLLAAQPVQLRCNYQSSPLGIDSAQPNLSWQSDSSARNWRQSAYQIFVASRPELAAAGKADVWDSGRQASSASVDIPYAGPALEARQRYFWSVTVWDADGHSTSALHPAWWEMGLLRKTDWTAAWIGSPTDSRELAAGLAWVWLGNTDALHTAPHTTATFRRSVDLTQAPVRASISVVTRGEISVSVNGRLVDHKKGWASFDRTDLTGMLHAAALQELRRIKKRCCGDRHCGLCSATQPHRKGWNRSDRQCGQRLAGQAGRARGLPGYVVAGAGGGGAE